MKTLNAMAVLLLATVAVLFAQSEKFYVTKETHATATFIPTAGQIEQAKQAKDARPAEDDPEGNWGQISEGFQLSIRLSKNTFTNGEPVSASILLRNVSDKPLTYYVSIPKDDEMKFFVKRGLEPLSAFDEIKTNMTFSEKVEHLNRGSGSSPVLQSASKENSL